MRSMIIFKFKKRIKIDKAIGNIKLTTINNGSFEDGKYKKWTELHLWYDKDCENCPCGWEYGSYEGECEDCGCFVSKYGDFSTPTLVCMLPNLFKRIILKIKRVEEY